ncbi:McrB family protein [Parapedobacter sp. DT-150]|uniref:McrB family protein n=1 Tax=Parapedobacter sp. DT-150 TaxID=3396162 RepID=UPI003F1B5F97
MQIKNKKATYDKFDEFVEAFLVGKRYLSRPGTEEQATVITLDNLNKCIETFVKNAITGKGDDNELNFESKAKQQFEVVHQEVKDLFAHCLWLWCFAVLDMTDKGKATAVNLLSDGLVDETDFRNLGFANGGTYHKQNKPNEIAFILLLLKDLVERHPGDAKTLEEKSIKQNIIKENIIKFIKPAPDAAHDTQQTEDPAYSGIRNRQNAIGNILLHLCQSENYEAIVSNSHKTQLAETFKGLLVTDQKKWEEWDIDDKLSDIRKLITEYKKGKEDFSFYDHDVRSLWNPMESELDTYLTYKKAVVLYGPPGTSKTYTANKLAQNLIVKEFLRKHRSEGMVTLLSEENRATLFADHTHHFQLHASLTYEDFIVGYQLRNGVTEVQPGKLLRVINEIREKGDGLPHVIILDEINRVDLSRLFGELFSAMESRGKEIVLPISGTFTLCVPENVYFIGTMNEIDFSLERVDFALRRRFLWQFMGFSEESLREMIESSLQNLRINGEFIDGFITNCKAVNSEINKDPDFGAQYQIGHAIFAEINGVVKTFRDTGKHSKNLKEVTNILWKISIRPLLEAYYGNADAATRETRLKTYEQIFTEK